MPNAFPRLLSALLLSLFALPGNAQLTIEIREGQADAVPIAIVPFGWQGTAEAPIDMAAIVAADLARTGRFAPMDRADMIDRPTSGHEVDFADWRLLGTEVVVVGRLSQEVPGEYLLNFQLFDVFREKQLLAYSIPATEGALRAAAHRVSDLVYEALTGERGAFSTRIAYISATDRGDAYELIVADADGANQQVVVQSTEPLLSPAWSPASDQLAYVAFEGAGTAIYTQDLTTGDRRKVSARPGVNGAPAWSPDGRQMAVALSDTGGNVDIHVIELASGDVRRLTRHPAIDTEPVWTHNGAALLFTSDRASGPQVYRVDVDGGTPRRLTFEGNYNARPRLAPDGEKIAVVHNDRGNYRIALVDLRTGASRVLTEGRLDESPSFAPNGSMIIYATEDRGAGILAAVSVDGRTHQRLVSRLGNVREPVWSPFPDSP